MKTKRQRALIALLSAVLAFTLIFSSCNSLVAPNDVSDTPKHSEAGALSIYSSVAESEGFAPTLEQSDISEISESTGESDSSEAIKDSEKNRRSTLTPILELGIGDGDYEVGFAKDDYGFKLGPSSFYVYKHETMIVDFVNKRVLVYKDNMLNDNVDISKLMQRYENAYWGMDCAFDDMYYYIVERENGLLTMIDRKTKSSTEIDLKAGVDGIDVYTKYCIDTVDSLILIYALGEYDKQGNAKTLSCMSISEGKLKKISKAPYECVTTKDSTCLRIDGKLAKLKIPADSMSNLEVVGKINGDRYVLGEFIRSADKDINGYGTSYTMFNKYNTGGSVEGRCLWRNYSVLNSNNGYVIGYDGELYVICDDVNYDDKSNGKFGIYKVNFGFDAIPGR